eukprot:scaffold161_cov172-Amphora_coffeaeformis.AAC.6
MVVLGWSSSLVMVAVVVCKDVGRTRYGTYFYTKSPSATRSEREKKKNEREGFWRRTFELIRDYNIVSSSWLGYPTLPYLPRYIYRVSELFTNQPNIGPCQALARNENSSRVDNAKD